MNDLILSVWVFGTILCMLIAIHFYVDEKYKPAKKRKEKKSEIDRRINELIKEIDNDRLRKNNT